MAGTFVENCIRVAMNHGGITAPTLRMTEKVVESLEEMQKHMSEGEDYIAVAYADRIVDVLDCVDADKALERYENDGDLLGYYSSLKAVAYGHDR